MSNTENLILIRSGTADWHWDNSDWITMVGMQGLFLLSATSVMLLALTWLFQLALRHSPRRSRLYPVSFGPSRGAADQPRQIGGEKYPTE